MIYQAFEAQAAMADLTRPIADVLATILRLPWPGTVPFPLAQIAARLESFVGVKITATRPAFRIEPVLVGNKLVEVVEETVARTPFTSLIHFRKDLATAQPKVLVVAPMSGHFATLLRSTIQTLLIDHDVYVTDWHNIRDVAPADGVFDLSTYVREVIGCLRAIGEGTHLAAVCQPVVPALCATALLCEDASPFRPASLTLMAGPVDTRINPTTVNKLAIDKPLGWFERHLIDRVPLGYRGAGRRVYPGIVQLAAFIGMNPERHKSAFAEMARARVQGDLARHATIKSFYNEYFAVMDLPAEFYLETVRHVFQEHSLPKGSLEIDGRKVDLAAISGIALLTVEGERDDICGLGQTMAAQDLCRSVRQYRKAHHVQTGVGHYGVFSGKRWVGEIYPKVRDTIAMAS